MKTPTLEELLERCRREVPYRGAAKEMARRVAAGERHPTNPPLPDNVVQFACQVLFSLMEIAEEKETKSS